ncbi:hypothetical protein Tco_0044304 [Tanacetum coccineum]
MGTHDDEAGSSRTKRSRQYETMEEVLLPQVHHEFLEWEGCNRDAKSRYNTKLAHLLPRQIYSSCVVNWDILNRMGCDEEIDGMLRINLCEAGTNEEIFTYVAWIRAFNINEPIYSELCHEFYSTYEFDEVCADDELGLYHAEELDEEGFYVYFQGGLRSDEHFNAQEYWLSISREENLSLSRSHASTIRNPTPTWVCECCLVDYEMDEKKRSWYSEREFITKLARKAMVLSDEVLRSLSALIYCRDLDTTTLRELINSEVFEHMDGVYNVPLQGAYNPPGYAQPQYDQYYQQYPSQQQQQPDDE